MAEKIGTTIVVQHTAPAACELCDKVDELRPYGPKGKYICWDCGRKDPQATHERMMSVLEAQLKGVTHVVLEAGVIGARGVTLRTGHLDADLASTNEPRE